VRGLRRAGAVEVDGDLRFSRLDDTEYHLAADLGPGVVACPRRSRPDAIEIQRLGGVDL
jgi:hypothetical protein